MKLQTILPENVVVAEDALQRHQQLLETGRYADDEIISAKESQHQDMVISYGLSALPAFVAVRKGDAERIAIGLMPARKILKIHGTEDSVVCAVNARSKPTKPKQRIAEASSFVGRCNS